MGDRLDRGVMMVLVDFTVDRLCGFLMTMRLHLFLGDSRTDRFVDIGAVSLVRGKIADGLFCCLHLGCVESLEWLIEWKYRYLMTVEREIVLELRQYDRHPI